MARKKMAANTNIRKACVPELTLTSVLKFQLAWQCLMNKFMIKNRNNIDAKLSRAATQHGLKTGFSSFFFLQLA